MMFFTNLSIRSKVILAFTVILIFTASIGVFSITRVALLNEDAKALESSVQRLEPLGMMSKDARQMVAIAAIGANETDSTMGQDLFVEIGRVRQEYTAQWADYAPMMDPGQETMDGNRFNAAFNELDASLGEMSSLYTNGNHAAVTDLLNSDIKNELHQFTDSIDDDLAYQNVRANSFTKNAKNEARKSITLISIVLLAMVFGTIAVAVLMVRGISGPIGHMTTAMRRLAQQDMDVAIPGIGRKDEIGAMAGAVQVFKENAQGRLKLEAEALEFQKVLDKKLKDMEAAFEASGRDQKLVVDGLAGALADLAKGDLTVRFDQEVADAYEGLKVDFNSAMETLQETMKSIAANTQGVRSGAGEITQASDDLSRRTEQQAASLEETAAALY
jgi:methyl-accepting chemotaxis protein